MKKAYKPKWFLINIEVKSWNIAVNVNEATISPCLCVFHQYYFLHQFSAFYQNCLEAREKSTEVENVLITVYEWECW